MAETPGWLESAQLLHSLSALYLSEVEDCGSGLAIPVGGRRRNAVERRPEDRIASAKCDMVGCGAAHDRLVEIVAKAYLSASFLSTGASPSCILKEPIALAPESS